MDDEFLSNIGNFIDMPEEEFNNWMSQQHVPLGTCNNYVHALTVIYEYLVEQKDALIKVYAEQKSEEVLNTLKGIYAELMKVESKAVCLKKHIKELLEKGV